MAKSHSFILIISLMSFVEFLHLAVKDTECNQGPRRFTSFFTRTLRNRTGTRSKTIAHRRTSLRSRKETYIWRCWITADFQYRRKIYGILLNTVMYESFTAYLTSIYGFGGRYRFEGTFVELCRELSVFKIFIRLHWNIAFNLSSQFEYNMSGTLKENKRSTPWLNFDDTSKFWGENCMGSSRFNIYRFFFASHLQMTHELSLKVYKVKACLLRLKCSVNSKYKTQVLFSLDRISFQFLYVIGRHISLIR